MKYPAHTTSTPVTGEQAKRFLRIIRSGGIITNPQREETIRRIAEARKARLEKAASDPANRSEFFSQEVFS